MGEPNPAVPHPLGSQIRRFLLIGRPTPPEVGIFQGRPQLYRGYEMQADNALQTTIFTVALMIYVSFTIFIDRTSSAVQVLFPDQYSHVYVAAFGLSDLGQDVLLGRYLGRVYGERFTNILSKPWLRTSRPATMLSLSSSWVPALCCMLSSFIICSDGGRIWYQQLFSL